MVITMRRLIAAAVGVLLCVYLVFSLRFFGGDQPTYVALEAYKSHVDRALASAYQDILIKPPNSSCEDYKAVLLELLTKLNISDTTQPGTGHLPPATYAPTPAPISTTSSSPPASTATPAPTTPQTPAPTTPVPTTPAPTPPPKRHLRLFAGILSSPSGADRRTTIRNTWSKLMIGTPREKEFDYKFIMGQIPEPTLNEMVHNEATQFGDIEFFPIEEGYRNIAHKTMAIMTYATANTDSDYVMKIDDDSFLHVPKLFEDLEHRPTEKFYMGMSIGRYHPDRNPASQWYMPHSEYAPHIGPALIVGCGYVLSKDAAAYLDTRTRDGTKMLSLEDVNTAVLLADAGVTATGHIGFHNMHQCFSHTVLSHYVPRDAMEKYYNNIKNGKDMCANKKRSFIETQQFNISYNDMPPSGICMYQ